MTTGVARTRGAPGAVDTAVGQGIWHSVAAPASTLFGILNQDLLRLTQNHAGSLPELRNARALLLASDYSGESNDCPYFVYSFLITSSDAWGEWDSLRLSVREKFLGDGRRMAFKRLSDDQRWQALGPFLDASDKLAGLSFSVAISKQCGSMFAGDAPLDLSNPEFAHFRNWKPAVIEKALVVVHFLGFLLAGLAGEGQNVVWFTDEDSIGANDDRVIDLTRLFSWVVSDFLEFSLGHCRCGTGRCDDGTRQIEDLLSIPDLVAGTLAEQMRLRAADPTGMPAAFWMQRGDYSEKAQRISWWLAQTAQPLKRLFCVVDPTRDGTDAVVSWFHFHDRTD